MEYTCINKIHVWYMYKYVVHNNLAYIIVYSCIANIRISGVILVKQNYNLHKKYLDWRWVHCWNTSWWWNLRDRTATVRRRSPGSPGLRSTRMARRTTPCRTQRRSPWLRTLSLCTDPLLTPKTRARLKCNTTCKCD